jgi:hypothetical protein
MPSRTNTRDYSNRPGGVVSWIGLSFSALLEVLLSSFVNNYKQLLRAVYTDRQSELDVGGA